MYKLALNQEGMMGDAKQVDYTRVEFHDTRETGRFLYMFSYSPNINLREGNPVYGGGIYQLVTDAFDASKVVATDAQGK